MVNDTGVGDLIILALENRIYYLKLLNFYNTLFLSTISVRSMHNYVYLPIQIMNEVEDICTLHFDGRKIVLAGKVNRPGLCC